VIDSSVMARCEAEIELPGSFHCTGIDSPLECHLLHQIFISCDVTVQVEGIFILLTGGFDLFSSPKTRGKGTTL